MPLPKNWRRNFDILLNCSKLICYPPVNQTSYFKLQFRYPKKLAHTFNTLLFLSEVRMHIKIKCCRHIGMTEYYAYRFIIALTFYVSGCKSVPSKMEQNPQSSCRQTSDDKTQPVWNERFRIILPDAGNATECGMARHFSYQAVSRLLPKQGQVAHGKWNCCAPVPIAPIRAVLQIKERLHSK